MSLHPRLPSLSQPAPQTLVSTDLIDYAADHIERIYAIDRASALPLAQKAIQGMALQGLELDDLVNMDCTIHFLVKRWYEDSALVRLNG